MYRFSNHLVLEYHSKFNLKAFVPRIVSDLELLFLMMKFVVDITNCAAKSVSVVKL